MGIKMDNKERTQAANALIQWFNSQDISQADAEIVILKVTAKILNRRFDRTNPASVTAALDEHQRILAHETIEAIYNEKRK
jgi:hypothetical protein